MSTPIAAADLGGTDDTGTDGTGTDGAAADTAAFDRELGATCWRAVLDSSTAAVAPSLLDFLRTDGAG